MNHGTISDSDTPLVAACSIRLCLCCCHTWSRLFHRLKSTVHHGFSLQCRLFHRLLVLAIDLQEAYIAKPSRRCSLINVSGNANQGMLYWSQINKKRRPTSNGKREEMGQDLSVHGANKKGNG